MKSRFGLFRIESFIYNYIFNKYKYISKGDKYSKSNIKTFSNTEYSDDGRRHTEKAGSDNIGRAEEKASKASHAPDLIGNPGLSPDERKDSDRDERDPLGLCRKERAGETKEDRKRSLKAKVILHMLCP